MAFSPKHSYLYVNGMRNVAWLVGYFRKFGDGYYIQQNNNEAQSLPLDISKNINAPDDKTPVEVMCHIYGERSNDAQQCRLRVIKIERPTVRSMPAFATWLRGQGKGENNEFKPFMKAGEIKAEFSDKLSSEDATEQEKVLAEWFQSSRNRLDSRLGEGSNKVFLAGFVGEKRFVPPNEFQTQGYGEIYLHQYQEPDRAIPIRLHTPAVMQLLKEIRKGRPVAFKGQMRMKITPDDEGNIRERNMHVRVATIYDIDPREDFISGSMPDWWTELFHEGRRETQQQSKPQGQGQGVAATAAENSKEEDPFANM